MRAIVIVRKAFKAAITPIRRVGQGFVTMGLGGMSADFFKGGHVQATVIVALLMAGGFLWTIANVLEDEARLRKW